MSEQNLRATRALTGRGVRRGLRSGLAASLVLGVLVLKGSPTAVGASPAGTLIVRASGLQHDRGKVVLKLFRRPDDVPKGASFRRRVVPATQGTVEVRFTDLPHGEYGLFVFHDENGNGTVDHNFLGIPKEPLGFSGGFRPSVFKLLPGFDDLKFLFDAKRVRQGVPLR